MHKIYAVGGAVRDEMLGRPVCDRDYVVVGATPQEMLKAGFRQVGSDFPVFLHPQTQDEYALARTERKSGTGYTGFTVYAAPDVTLEEDLGRRDLTINAMARGEDGVLVDPYSGKEDLEARVLRHVNGASFVEDPVRVLRIARFAARYQDFTVAPETMVLLRQMVESGELDNLVPERVWNEFAKGLMEGKPSRMFEVLRECGALNVLLPELAALEGQGQHIRHHPEYCSYVHSLLVVDHAASINAPLEVRYACIMHDLGKGLTPKSELPSHHKHEETGIPLVEAVNLRFKVPSVCADLAVMTCREHQRVHRALEMTAGSFLGLFARCDAFRRPERFKNLILACVCDARGRTGFETRDYPQAELLERGLAAAMAVPAGDIAKSCTDRQRIPERILQARILAIKAAIAKL